MIKWLKEFFSGDEYYTNWENDAETKCPACGNELISRTIKTTDHNGHDIDELDFFCPWQYEIMEPEK